MSFCVERSKLILTERSESTIRQSTFDIRHSNVVSHEQTALEPKARVDAWLDDTW
ncbi:hypothetical protein D1AOALGA4SA_12313 [Olavius algarvensis Delta 1 endosymbiont]|nr:hypothetical protein D1AOALGA4SA_12313 [Olavius algarvensis Delta 1 endosymbiont]